MLRAATGVFEEALRGIQAEIGELEARVAALEGAWTGEASRAFQRAHAEWSASLKRMESLLRKAKNAQSGALERHLAARAEVTALWK